MKDVFETIDDLRNCEEAFVTFDGKKFEIHILPSHGGVDIGEVNETLESAKPIYAVKCFTLPDKKGNGRIPSISFRCDTNPRMRDAWVNLCLDKAMWLAKREDEILLQNDTNE